MSEPVRPLLLGHRGARAVRSIPENTLESFDRALADGCDGFEFDVRLTADAVPVICHDPRYRGCEIACASSAQLRELPRLEEVLSRYQERAFLDIELKVAGLEKITLALLQRHSPKRGYVVSSFLPQVLYAIKAEDDHVPLGLICETRKELLRWEDLAVDFVIPHQRLVTAPLLHRLHQAGKRVVGWTVNNPAFMVRLRDLDIDGIISDDPELLCRALSGGSRGLGSAGTSI
jgi:glycerophosphoryl diester phosphodiesterase